MQQFKVSANTKVAPLAGAIERTAHRDGSLEVIAMGAKAVNKAMISVALANIYIAKRRKYLGCTPYFEKEIIEGKKMDKLRIVIGAFED